MLATIAAVKPQKQNGCLPGIVRRHDHNKQENQVGQYPPDQPGDQVRIRLAQNLQRGCGQTFRLGTLLDRRHKKILFSLSAVFKQTRNDGILIANLPRTVSFSNDMATLTAGFDPQSGGYAAQNAPKPQVH